MLSAYLFALGASLVAAAPTRSCASCRNIPGDPGWPTAAQWSELNATVSGRLIATNPLSHVCHDPTYDEEACNALKEVWGPPAVQLAEPAEFFSPYFLNQTCVPQTEREQPCELGNYASYSIDVRGPEDVAAGLAFSEQYNIRVSILNTGHDFLGKSAGLGSLSLWTYNLKGMDFIESYNSSYYNGPAAKLGAGVAGGDAVAFAGARGYRVLTGNCPSVGASGGFTQGGGFGPLTGLYGLGSDNVLEWEVVTANGTHLVATPTQNEDLYYALSGGGGGTYGVVLSMTTRVHPEEPVVGAMFNFNVTAAGGVEPFWSAVTIFLSHVGPLVEQGLLIGFDVREGRFTLQIAFAPDGSTPAQLTEKLQPLLDDLAEHNGLTAEVLAVGRVATPNFYQLYRAMSGPFALEGGHSVVGSRFFSRDTVTNNAAGVADAFRTTTDGGLFNIVCQGFDASRPTRSSPVAETGATESWRDALFTCFFPTLWDWETTDVNENWAKVPGLQERMVDVILPAMAAVGPNDGAYLNEGNHAQPDFQRTFYGSNYERLRSIKKTHDPSDIFFAVTAVGSEVWAQDRQGRLCRTGIY
ncbi:hypothetical protein S7711_10195 [Stachybotrys chartarum IBT 7711]|uniref:FAD-binding PCMH-type domain-containing protein n=1 Tax=Stachybotrys chartarum (strain CBS 109288 / IBT 7711) TaxID=1280523 RepID=A0A084AF21_STACB|nr:hypothetical protein S7711_10195 [Stachybotrys chartarum IBT 7711]